MKRLLSISILAGILLSSFIFVGTTHATYFGGKWQHNMGSTTTLYYTYNSPQRYNGNVWQGAANWRAAATYIKPTPGSSNIKITVNDVYTSSNWYGQAWLLPAITWNPYSSAGYQLNQRLMDPLPDFDRTFVATHEFGHTLGLAHTTGTTADSVMYAGGGGFPWYNTPMPYDQGQINGLYN